MPDSLFARRWLPLIYAAVLLVAAWSTHFAVLINDVFALRWQAEHLSLAHPESFYNGFFPIGYPLLLRAASVTGNPVLVMILLQIALTPLYVALVYWLIVRLVPGRAALIAMPFALFTPPTIHAVFSATPDFLASLSALAGFVLLTRSGRWNFLLSGACIGVGCMLRSHVLVLAVTLALALLLFHKGMRLRAFFGFCGGAIPFVIAQGLVQVWSGHGFFENAQAFNVWRAMHGMNWSNPPALAHTSASEVISQNPALFFSSACNWLVHYWFYLAPFVAVIALGRWPARWRAISIHPQCKLLAIAALMYLAMMSIGGSISAFTTVLPMDAACLASVMQSALGSKLELRRWFIPLLASMCWIGGWTGLLCYSAQEAKRIEDYSRIEQVLGVRSHTGEQPFETDRRAVDPHQIYTDDYDFYFPGLRYQTPRTFGGWGEVGLAGYLHDFPHIRNSSANMEHDDLVRNGITWAIYRVPPYDPQGYQSVRSDTSLFRLMYRTRSHEIYRVEGGERK